MVFVLKITGRKQDLVNWRRIFRMSDIHVVQSRKYACLL